jgi:hypothetical protein
VKQLAAAIMRSAPFFARGNFSYEPRMGGLNKGSATALKLARDGADGIVTYRQRKEAATRGKFRG